MNKSASSKSSGFTLIELLVVISIVGMLASVVMVATGGTRFKSKIVVMKKEFEQLKLAMQIYYDGNGNKWGGTLQQTAGTCPTTGSTMFASTDIKKLLDAIALIYPGSTLQCISTNDVLNATIPDYWTVLLTVPGRNGGTDKWCLDNYDVVGGGPSSNGVLRVTQGSYNVQIQPAVGTYQVTFCGESNSPGTPYVSPDW